MLADRAFDQASHDAMLLGSTCSGRLCLLRLLNIEVFQLLENDVLQLLPAVGASYHQATKQGRASVTTCPQLSLIGSMWSNSITAEIQLLARGLAF